MQSKQRSLDGTQHKTGVSKTPHLRKARVVKKQITRKKTADVKKRSGTQVTVATKPTPEAKQCERTQKTFIGIDLHKKFL